MLSRRTMRNRCLAALAFLLTACSYPAEGGAALRIPTLPPPVSTSAPAPQREATPAAPASAVVEYRNEHYGFGLALPASWQGFSVRVNEWEAFSLTSEGTSSIVARGPQIAIIHPRSTPTKPRQDIPIMVFTTAQWEHLQRGEWHIGAAPINPSELGRNSRYVFALPARYNYAFPEGYEEVEAILRSRPLRTFEPAV